MSSWTANYDGNAIRIENSWWLNKAKLFVNNKLQDEQWYLYSSVLTGHLGSKDGERKEIKVTVSCGFTTFCRLFIDDEKVEVR